MRESVLVVLAHQDEIFCIKRQNALAVFSGHHSFPGGKVDKEDEKEGEWSKNFPLSAKYSPDLMNAVYREVKEELGFDLLQALENDEVENIEFLGLAITPDFNPHRFKNHYFGIKLKTKPSFIFDLGEIEYGDWKKPKDHLADFHNNNMLIVPPMRFLIEALIETPGKWPKQRNFELEYDSQNEVPMIECLYGVKQFLPLSNTFPPANRTNCFLIGDHKRVLIDPSPKNEEEKRKLINSVRPFGVDFIFLTHHHPDHHQFCVDIAKEFGVGIGLSKDSYQRIIAKYGEDYFAGITPAFFKEGQVLTQVRGLDVFIYEVPGHDEGQLALAPSDLKWFLAGDLIQSVGTVLIARPEGNMRKYFQSLEKVMALSPRYVFPSHGIALGGVHKIRQTLEHRKEREEGIKKLHLEGHSEKEILHTLYSAIDPRLHPYALATIEAHLEKIKEDLN